MWKKYLCILWLSFRTLPLSCFYFGIQDIWIIICKSVCTESQRNKSQMKNEMRSSILKNDSLRLLSQAFMMSCDLSTEHWPWPQQNRKNKIKKSTNAQMAPTKQEVLWRRLRTQRFQRFFYSWLSCVAVVPQPGAEPRPRQ